MLIPPFDQNHPGDFVRQLSITLYELEKEIKEQTWNFEGTYFGPAKFLTNTASIGHIGESLFDSMCNLETSSIESYIFRSPANKAARENGKIQAFVPKVNGEWDAIIKRKSDIKELKKEIAKWANENNCVPDGKSLRPNDVVNLYLHNNPDVVVPGAREVKVEIKTSLLAVRHHMDYSNESDGIQSEQITLTPSTYTYSIHGLKEAKDFDLLCSFFIAPDSVYYGIDTKEEVYRLISEENESREQSRWRPYTVDRKTGDYKLDANGKYINQKDISLSAQFVYENFSPLILSTAGNNSSLVQKFLADLEEQYSILQSE